MKRLIPVIICGLFLLAVFSCGKENPAGSGRVITATYTSTPSITMTPTITMTPALYVEFAAGGMVDAEVQELLLWIPVSATGFGVRLKYNDVNGKPYTGAAINVDGNTLTDSDSKGEYLYYILSRTYLPGDTVNFNIITGIGSVSAVLTMPDSAVVTLPSRGASLNQNSDNSICWYYPGNQPSEVSVAVAGNINGAQAYVDVVLPGSARNFIIPAGTLPENSDELYLIVGGINYTSLSGVEPWSNSFNVRNGNALIISTQ